MSRLVSLANFDYLKAIPTLWNTAERHGRTETCGDDQASASSRGRDPLEKMRTLLERAAVGN
jgi:hypothetical protein